MSVSAPLDSLDIGQPWSRWPGEPNFENGKLVCPVSTFIRSFGLPSFRTALVGLPRSPLDPKRRAGSGGTAVVVTFSTGVQSVSSHWTLVTVLRDFSRRSVASRRVRLVRIFRESTGKVPFSTCILAQCNSHNLAKFAENWCLNKAKILNF